MIEQKASYDDDALIYVFVTLYYKQPKTIMKDNQPTSHEVHDSDILEF